MTSKARKVLDDCKIALAMLEDEEDHRKWNVIWAGGITLLRTVGDVLHRIDGRDENGEKNRLWDIQNKIFSGWKGSPDHAIFEFFIKHERDNLVHRYESSVSTEKYIPLVVVDEKQNSSELFEIDTDLFRPMLGEYGSNEDARDVFRDAIIWWETQLSKIEIELQK